MLAFLALYAALIDPRWTVREAAEQSLLHLVDRHPAIYGPRLAELAREATEPEIRARVRRPLIQYRKRLAASYVPSGVPVWPCSDMRPAPCSWLVYSRRPGYTVAPGPTLNNAPWWWSFRENTERMARSMILHGAEPAEVDRVIQRMWVVERQVQCDCPAAWETEASHWKKWQGGFPAPQTSESEIVVK